MRRRIKATRVSKVLQSGNLSIRELKTVQLLRFFQSIETENIERHENAYKMMIRPADITDGYICALSMFSL